MKINALIAIVWGIEITQSLSTNEMLLTFFGQNEILKIRRNSKN